MRVSLPREACGPCRVLCGRRYVRLVCRLRLPDVMTVERKNERNCSVSRFLTTSRGNRININRTQAAEITPGSDGMVPSAAAWRCLQQAMRDATERTPLSLQGVMGVHTFLSLVTLTFDLWPWHSNCLARGTKHVFPVTLTQMRSAVNPRYLIHNQKSHRQR